MRANEAADAIINMFVDYDAERHKARRQKAIEIIKAVSLPPDAEKQKLVNRLINAWDDDAEELVKLVELINRIRQRAIRETTRVVRAECAQIAEETTRQPMDYIDWSPGPAADDRALRIATLIRAVD